MTDSKVYDLLHKPIENKDVPAFINQFLLIMDIGLDNKKAGGNLAWWSADIISNLIKAGLLNEALPIVKTWLTYSDKIPVSENDKHYFASFAVYVADKYPELQEEFELKLLSGDWFKSDVGRLFASFLCKWGKIDTTMSTIVKSFGVLTQRNYFLENEELKNLYNNNLQFRDFLDKLENDWLNSFENPDKKPNPENFEEVLAASKADLLKEDHWSNPENVLNLIKFTNVECNSRIEEFLKSGFQELKSAAIKKSILINCYIFDALARAIAHWQNPEFSELLIQEFNFVIASKKDITDGLDRHYELQLVSGTIALALVALGYKGDLSFFDKFLESYELHYKGDDFVMKVKYAKWMITGDAGNALSYLTNKENTKGLSYVICALTDLNSKESLSVIKELATSFTNPVTREVIKESLSRLSKQAQPPEWKDRMIHLFGVVSPGEQAIGYESDNVFVIRAQETENNPEIGTRFEADDSAPDDL